MPLPESSSVAHVFDHQAPSSVTNGPCLQVVLSLTCPVFIKKKAVPFHVLGAEVFQLEIQISIWDPVIFKQNWLKSSQKQRNNGNNDRVIFS